MLRSLLRPLKHKVRDVYYQCHRVNETPLFVLGNQKSGTSAICWLLANAANKSLTLDITRSIAKPDWQLALRNRELPFDTWVNTYRYEFSKDIIKEPSLSMFNDDLVARFPDANYLYIVRDPRDNIRSILNRVKIAGDSRDKNIADNAVLNAPAWQRILDSDWLTGQPTKTMIESLAHRWCYLNEQYLKHQGQMHLVRYEDFRENKAQTIYALLDELGMPTVKNIDQQVNVQKQPKGDNSLTWNAFFKEENLAMINEITAEHCAKFGYPQS
ncbi:sulfotransferase [Aestuariibacter sp. AA17]|uniref:Sulfotransferase n=1 Tax=Fluctibacter corallii TaxID=2984329 RepID=A0ABT3A426_9ALTE|nr:sulfotransferase [Aestuariibacter sp. AA17]MCV2883284.1 sulfotransferase [Aestuariibacter sp. AA17]